MKCQDCQRDLLNAEEFDTLPAETEAAPGGLCECREFQQQLPADRAQCRPSAGAADRAKTQSVDKILNPAAPSPRPALLPRRSRSALVRLERGRCGRGGRPRRLWHLSGQSAVRVPGEHTNGARNMRRAGSSPLPPQAGPAALPRLTTRLLDSDLRLAEADTPRGPGRKAGGTRRCIDQRGQESRPRPRRQPRN